MLSIVIPVYNVEKYIEECTNSVLGLNYNYEIILVDDGSTDKSGVLCDDIAANNTNVKVIHKKNSGLSVARNTGVLNSCGDYVMFLDSDDFIDREEFQKIIKALDSGADVIVGMYKNYFTETKTSENEVANTSDWKKGLISAEEFLNLVPRDGESFYMVACRFIIKRSILVENNCENLFMPGIYHEDEEWTQRVLCRVKSIYLTDAYFYQYRQAREGAITFSVKPKAVWDILTVVEHALCERKNYDKNHYKYEYLSYRAAQQFFNVIMRSEVLEKQDRRKICKKLKLYKKECFPYMYSKKAKFAKLVVATFGMDLGSEMLHLIKRSVRSIKRK